MNILIPGIEINNSLEILDFENKSITAISCSKLNHILYSHDNIKILKLNRNPLKNEGIFNLLQSHNSSSSEGEISISKLKELHISNIQLDKDSAMIFITVMKSIYDYYFYFILDFPDLTVLLLNHNDFENTTPLFWEYFIYLFYFIVVFQILQFWICHIVN